MYRHMYCIASCIVLGAPRGTKTQLRNQLSIIFVRFADSETIVRLSLKHLARNVLSKGGPENPLIYPIGSAVSGVDG